MSWDDANDALTRLAGATRRIDSRAGLERLAETQRWDFAGRPTGLALS